MPSLSDITQSEHLEKLHGQCAQDIVCPDCGRQVCKWCSFKGICEACTLKRRGGVYKGSRRGEKP